MVTIIGVFLSRSAAVAARDAATDAKQAIRQLDVVVDISSILAMMEEIKHHHRSSQWDALPYRYSILRSKLISINGGGFKFSEDHQQVISDAIQQFSKMEATIERVLAGKVAAPSFEKLNQIVSNQIDRLTALLSELKSKIEGQ